MKSPDGTRTIDIEVLSLEGKPTITDIEVIDLPQGRHVGVDVVDAVDSKRTDLRADAMLICSNTGFDAAAVSKAKRKRIGLISVLRQGDSRIKAVISEEAYLTKIDVRPTKQTSIEGDALPTIPHPIGPYDLRYRGKPVNAWLYKRIAAVLVNEVMAGKSVASQDRLLLYNFKSLTNLHIGQYVFRTRSISVKFTVETRWLRQVVELDATSGIFDCVRSPVKLASGQILTSSRA